MELVNNDIQADFPSEVRAFGTDAPVVRIGTALIEKALVTKDQVELAVQKQKVTGERLGELLLRLGIVSEYDLALLLAEQKGIAFCDIDELPTPEPEVLQLFNHQFCLSRSFLPIKREGETLLLVVGNTKLGDIEQAVNRQTGLRCQFVQGEFSKVLQSVRHHFYFASHPVEALFEKEATLLERDHDQVLQPDKLINHLLHLGVKQRAADIHIQPEQLSIHISFRVDGVLRPIMALSPRIKRLVAAIKMKSGMDISDNLRPQDGSFSIVILDTQFDIRVSTVITEYGENLVMRLLPSGVHVKGLAQLGFMDEDLDLVNAMFSNPHGILLMTGPTGSGKSTTLHSGLRANGMEGKNIVTVEDPIEYKVPIIRQTQVNRKANYNFDTAIRHFLRHDPDVMLVGEIRDSETAVAAITAAETGHLVLSTLHVNSVLGVVPRLQALGIPPQMVADSLVGVINQRLVRKICSFCLASYTPSEEDLSYLSHADVALLYRGDGCARCDQTGYLGRVPIYEILKVDSSLSELIAVGATRAELSKAMRKSGLVAIEDIAIKRVESGHTTLAEVKRVLGNSLEELRR